MFLSFFSIFRAKNVLCIRTIQKNVVYLCPKVDVWSHTADLRVSKMQKSTDFAQDGRDEKATSYYPMTIEDYSKSIGDYSKSIGDYSKSIGYSRFPIII